MDNRKTELIKEARKFLDVKWVHQGRSKSGVDCVGFLLIAFKNIGITLLEIKGYSRTPDGEALKKIMDEQPNLRKLDTNESLEAGDVVLFRIRKHPQHVCLVTPSTTAKVGMIHSYNGGEKKVIEHDFVDYWKKRIVSVYRLK